MLSRRERERAILSGIDPWNTFLRRSVSRVVLLISAWLGFCLGTLTVLIVDILLMGGPKLLSDVWNQTESEPRLLRKVCLRCLLEECAVGFASAGSDRI
jgi:hypothetical protein